MAISDQTRIPAITELQNISPATARNEEQEHRVVVEAQDIIDTLMSPAASTKANQSAIEDIDESFKTLLLSVVTFCPKSPGRSRLINSLIAGRMEAHMIIQKGGDY